jgi:hypothetical protein
MAIPEDEGSQKTIWQELDVWAQDFRPWQRFVLASAVRQGRLTDPQIEQAYSLFLYDNDLGSAPNPPIEVPSTITGRPAWAAPAPIWLRRVCDLHAINALPSTAELTFSPALTGRIRRKWRGEERIWAHSVERVLQPEAAPNSAECLYRGCWRTPGRRHEDPDAQREKANDPDRRQIEHVANRAKML